MSTAFISALCLRSVSTAEQALPSAAQCMGVLPPWVKVRIRVGVKGSVRAVACMLWGGKACHAGGMHAMRVACMSWGGKACAGGACEGALSLAHVMGVGGACEGALSLAFTSAFRLKSVCAVHDQALTYVTMRWDTRNVPLYPHTHQPLPPSNWLHGSPPSPPLPTQCEVAQCWACGGALWLLLRVWGSSTASLGLPAALASAARCNAVFSSGSCEWRQMQR